jgi:hypothetical protein
MNWEKACQMIFSNIQKGLEINTKNSSFRKILEIPPFQCIGYNNCEGFKVRIGSSSTIVIPLSMLKSTYESAIMNNNTYDNSVFIKLYSIQQTQHPCHVHVVGQIFVHSKLAKQVGNRSYKLLEI